MSRTRTAAERARWKERRRRVTLPLVLALSVPVGLTPVAQAADGGGLGSINLPAQRVSKVRAVTGLGAKKAHEHVANDRKKNNAEAARARAEQHVTWPRAAAAELPLRGARTKSVPGGLPVAVTSVRGTAKAPSATGTAHLEVLDQKAADRLGITGVVLTATADSPGQAEVRVDYRAFASAVGGGWSGRLHLVELPACAVTTPQKAECRTQTPIASHNDAQSLTVTGKVRLGATDRGLTPQLGTSVSGTTVMALTASSAGSQSPKGTGDYGATPLSASSSWSAGGNSGSFTWNYGFTLPPAAAGPTPSLGLSYDSGSVDGRTAATNNQSTSVGEGFSLTESYIERSYGSCDKDGQTDVFDLCWKYDNARIVLNGKSSRLVKVSDTTWRLENDDASKVTRSTGADNNDDDGEYWTVVTGDGTKYVFGLSKLPGATTERTNSTWNVPVFGDDSGEPGYDKGSAFADRSLLQAWRWNLDYVEDTRGNAATYWYAKETNYYKKNKATTANAVYARGGYLKEIKYGLRKDVNGSLFTDDADAKVTFTYAERCTAADCSSLTKATSQNWPDVPFDSICAKDSTDCLAASPSFFTRKRLTGVDTFSWNATTSVYDPVDSWNFTQQYLDGGDIGDTSDQVLALMSITRSAKAGATEIPMKPVSFTYQMRHNRVDATDDILPLTRPRISTVTTETGAITTVTLSDKECVRSEVLAAAQDSNTRNCYPQFWNINGSPDASVDWFHKYRVLGVTESDPAGQNDAVENAYEYSGAAWHYNDDPLTPKNERTWSDWRGYRQVTVYKGANSATQPRSKSISLYMQGMNGDKNADGTAKAVSIAPLAQPSVGASTLTDSDQYSGQLREQVTYNGTTPISAIAHQPWSQETARQSDVPDAGDHVARFVRTKLTTTYTYLTASDTWWRRAVQTTFDSYGMASTVYDSGDYNKSGDETCTRTWYARNDAAGLTRLASRIRTVGKSCSVADADLAWPTDDKTRGDVLSDAAVAYDGATDWTESMTPTKGLPTWTGRAKGYAAGGTPTWQKLVGTGYDALGRPTSTTDVNDLVTSQTTYTPSDAGPLTTTRVLNAKSHPVLTLLDPKRGQPLHTYDANGKHTELAYDALGRLTDVWLPNRSHSLGQTPNTKYAYNLSNTTQSWVSTSSLRKDGTTYNTSYAIYDSLLRPLQTQSPTPSGGRLLTDTRYDTRGLVYQTHSGIFDTPTTPNGVYARAEYGEAPTQTDIEFDGAGRAISSTLRVYGVAKGTITTTYTGDSVATSALTGGSATRTISDARGRTVETREYAGETPADPAYGGGLGTAYTSSLFTYALDNKQQSITGPDKAQWTYTYDLFGRQVATTDPDKGTTTTDYDTLDRVITTTGGGKTVLTEYDELNRPTNTWAGTKSPATLLTNRTYDTPFRGLPATSTSYATVGSSRLPYTKKVTAYDSMSRPTTTQLLLPAEEPLVKAGTIPATLDFSSSYDIDGTLLTSTEPALGGLPSEIVSYTYNDLGLITGMSGLAGYLQNVGYTPLGQVEKVTLGTGGTGAKNVYIANVYEPGTGRLTQSSVTDQTHPYLLQDLKYTYDLAGNVLSIADPTTMGGTGKAETQCFAYDGYRRLAEAWTPTSLKCSDARSASTLDGPAPYWTSYTYNQGGQRLKETQHGAGGDTTTTYCYDPAKQPHALRYTTTRTDCGTAADLAKDKVYDYDTSGNTIKRPGTTGQQVLAWSNEGQLSTLTEGTNVTDYVYDADGTLLLRGSKDGERVLYAGATELHLPVGKSAWAQRTYTAGGAATAIRTNQSGTAQVQYLAGDHHGTQSLAVTSDTTQKVTKRYMTPFGAERGGSVGTWPTDRGFLDKTADKTTGLTHIGAREYDPVIGQFISVDPLLSMDQHQSLNGYSYANQHPATTSDPTGQRETCGAYGNSCYEQDYNNDGSDNNDGDRKTTGGAECHNDPDCKRSHNSPGTSSVDDLGDGKAPLLPETLAKEWLTTGYPSERQLRSTNQGYYDVLSYELNLELYYREQCSFGGMNDPCGAIRKFYGGWKHVDSIGSVDTCPVCSNSGLPVVLAMEGIRGCKCFLAGTDVLMADGTTKDIDKIEVGDEVRATDPETGKSGIRKVTRRIVTEDDKLFNELVISTPRGQEKLTATHEHPFWSPSERRWVPAGELAEGMTLLTDRGKTVTVVGNRGFAKRARTFNLTVDDLHTYYVLAGQTPVLVHNSNGWCGPGLRTTSEAGISPNDAKRIQNAADKAGQPIIVVGSRANGTPNPTSDWDYILSGPSRTRHSVKNSLPRGMGDGEGSGRGRDFWQSYNPNRPDYAELDRNRPYVVFEPRSR